MLRKLTPYLLFAVLGILFVVLKPYYQEFFSWFYHATPLTAGNATGAQIEAAQAAGGWVPSGAVASKFLTAAAAYILFALLPWWVQRLTHPAPTAWAKGPADKARATEDTSYSVAFERLSFVEKFTVYQRLQLVNVIRAAAALVFAALVV